ncbi:hypothetical protein ATN88_00120 [Enterovibrio coralii]|uniref:Uncharacterized protein n=2 Tax=Enterovibrio coralii TaxID=294935 RepID=A0A135I8J8_9GAMM|nr:hypothetical protein ATN88_00120 [Enterovibrio coralii]
MPIDTPLHAIHIDLSHASEAIALFNVIGARLAQLETTSPEHHFLFPIYKQLLLDIELLESLGI